MYKGFNDWAEYRVDYVYAGNTAKVEKTVFFGNTVDAADFIGCAYRTGGWDYMEISGIDQYGNQKKIAEFYAPYVWVL